MYKNHKNLINQRGITLYIISNCTCQIQSVIYFWKTCRIIAIVRKVARIDIFNRISNKRKFKKQSLDLTEIAYIKYEL